MDHSWRLRPPPPPIQGNVCPICSIHHFPFCPPRHPNSLDQNPRFQPHNFQSFQRPFFDPFLDPPGPNVNLHRPFGNPGDRFGDPQPWHRNPVSEYGQFRGHSQIGESGMISGGYNDGFPPSRFDHGGAGFKRMRVDEMGVGSFVDEKRLNSSISMDDERRLKLIRDHGGVSSGAAQGRANWAGMGVDVQESLNFDVSCGGFDDGVVHRRFNDLRSGRNDMTFRQPTNYEIDDFRDPRFSDFNRKGSSFCPEPDFGTHNHGEEHGLAFGQQNLQSYKNDELWKSQYGEEENSLHQSLPTNGHTGKETQSSHPTGWHGTLASSATPHEQSSFTRENRGPNYQPPQPYAMKNPMQLNHDIHFRGQLNDRRQSYEVNVPSHDSNQGPVGHRIAPEASQFGPQRFNKQGSYVPAGNGIISEKMTPMQASRVFNVQPPLPASPPPPLPGDPPGHFSSDRPRALPSPAKPSSSLFPITVSSAATMASSYAAIPEPHSLARHYFHDKSHLHASAGFATEEFPINHPTSSKKNTGEGQPFPLLTSDKPKVVDASHIFKQPHRATRPDHIVIIFRGLPGSGKSYLAKMLRDLEVENGGNAPRIHSMDDYFMTEVEKVEESDASKSSGSVRGKKPVMKRVMEYCYEPEMEEAYRSSMLKAFKKTLDEGVFSFVIVDDRNLRVADFAQFWATGKRSGFEVYLLEATYKDPAGCAARNVHGFTQNDIQRMAGEWEEAPSLYLRLDIKPLFQGDNLKESEIQEVDMDTEDADLSGNLPGSEERDSEITGPPVRDYSLDGSSKDGKIWNAEGDHQREEVKELGRSKWSDDLDDDNAKRTEATKGNLNALSGLIKAYTKEGKSVHWSDQVGNIGFSIGASRKVNASLVIGPGSGYNLKSNPMAEEQVSTQNAGEPRRQSVFQERIRAERESFKAVFDKRRQRIGGLDLEED